MNAVLFSYYVISYSQVEQDIYMNEILIRIGKSM